MPSSSSAAAIMIHVSNHAAARLSIGKACARSSRLPCDAAVLPKNVKMHHLLGRQAGAEQPGKLWTHQTAAGRQIAVHHAWNLHLQCEHIFLRLNSQTMYGRSDCRKAVSVVLLAGDRMHRCDKRWQIGSDHCSKHARSKRPEQVQDAMSRCFEKDSTACVCTQVRESRSGEQ